MPKNFFGTNFSTKNLPNFGSKKSFFCSNLVNPKFLGRRNIKMSKHQKVNFQPIRLATMLGIPKTCPNMLPNMSKSAYHTSRLFSVFSLSSTNFGHKHFVFPKFCS
jgi:hypothetical protein